jgi:AraC-like DNA-binding protein
VISPIAVARFSTDDFPPRQRFAAWREVLGRSLLNVEVEPTSAGPFYANATMRALPGIKILSGSTSGVIYRRPQGQVQDDDLVFSFGATRGSHAQQRNREAAAAEDGDALLMLGAEWSMVARASEGSLCALRVPRSAITASVRNVEDLYCQRIAGNVPSLQLLRRYLTVLDDLEHIATFELQQTAANHVIDLIALTLGATRDAAQAAEGRGLRAARLQSIKKYVLANLSDERLSVHAVAARHEVTSRHVQRLFEETGTTFTEYVLGQRLARAHRLLTDARLAERTLTTIAFEIGFSDLSYFNRAFRRRFGATPSEVRPRVNAPRGPRD